ncbi:MAG: alanine racemase [Lachnospiraceae bacterium]|nr:alanine racemase [Lachnospiraceae bacterium]
MKEYYRVQADINLDAIYNNILNTRKIIDEKSKIMAIIKADGYGHGSVAIAKTIDELVGAYGVATVEEAIELRKAGINKMILILGVTHRKQYDLIIKYDISQTVFKYEDARLLSLEAKNQGKTAKIHIKLDTGMGRIGYKINDESIDEIVKISKLDNINIEGIFTHFACADEKDKTSANKQLALYDEFVNKLSSKGVEIPIKHVSNSAGIIDMPYANKDIVRSGISTYGLYPSDEVDKERLKLEPAMSIKSYITYIKTLEAGYGISYNSTYVTNKTTKIATVPVGYADGFPRQLSSKGRVLINGQYAPIIGRICMDQFMVDVTDIEDVKEFDEVVIVGKSKDKYISVEEQAKLSGSFNYEFVCDIGKRIPRVYFRNNKKVGTFDYYECTDVALDME